MRYFWTILNSIAVVLALRGGYTSLTPEKLHRTNPEPVLCLILLLGVPVFALLSIGYSLRRSKTNLLARPSWARNPFNWWGDPLQSLFVATCIMGATALGSAVQHPAFGSVGFWMLGVYSCIAIGLLVGQILAYRIYRERIAPAS
jgi:hypothetical protein